MNQMIPALQKFYNALKHLTQFSTESSFFDNVGSIDVFLSEYRSTTLVLQTSIGGPNNPIYKKNLENFLLKNKEVTKWLNDNRVIVIHNHPFKLEKILRITIYDSAKAVIFKQYEQSIEFDEPTGSYLEEIRNTFREIEVPDVYFSVQYLYVDEEDSKERSVFDFIENGVVTMWQFLHAMKKDLNDESKTSNDLMREIDVMIQQIPHRWMIDALDYCYYRSTDTFEKGESFSLSMPDVHIPVDSFMKQVKQLSSTDMDFYEAFIYLHSFIYIKQNHHLLSTFFLEYGDNTYQMITFSASLRTTMYRYINRVSKMIYDNDIINVYLVTEAVRYQGMNIKHLPKFLQLNYEERKQYITGTYLSFYKVTSAGDIFPITIDTDDLIDRLSVSAVMGKIKTTEQPRQVSIMMSPIVDSFKKKRST
ncbi:MAG: hypothetical protein IKX25_07210 [Bacteroidales bacterium]|nr:hypothetical protein [Bacteroidales bacterium]